MAHKASPAMAMIRKLMSPKKPTETNGSQSFDRSQIDMPVNGSGDSIFYSASPKSSKNDTVNSSELTDVASETSSGDASTLTDVPSDTSIGDLSTDISTSEASSSSDNSRSSRSKSKGGVPSRTSKRLEQNFLIEPPKKSPKKPPRKSLKRKKGSKTEDVDRVPSRPPSPFFHLREIENA